jgi:hypothetical protein
MMIPKLANAKPPTKARLARVAAELETVRARASENGLIVCGTYLPDGTPRYFVVAPDASEAEVRRAAFTAREGRPMSGAEETLLRMAEQGLRSQHAHAV